MGSLLRGLLSPLLILAALLPAVPAAAEVDFLTDLIMSEEQERRLAEQEHPKILEQFGGEYRDPELQAYVSSIADFLGQTSRRPDIRYRLTILNSPVVNAFALPAGYLYVTRGLLALADSEAELAGVIAHEIGHVTARHTAQRYSRALIAQGIVGLLGAATQNTGLAGIAQLAEPVAVIALQSYSRRHEYESDLLAVETMSRAGYDPRAMASFLGKLGAHTRLDAEIAGRGGEPDQLNLLSTHPRTADRVENAIQAAGGIQVPDPMWAREIYLQKIDGMLYGDDPAQGLVRGNRFIHGGLALRFEVPEGFTLLNGTTQVTAAGPEGASIAFDRVAVDPGLAVDDYLRGVWAKDVALQEVERLAIDGFRAATGTLRLEQNGVAADVRIAAIRRPDQGAEAVDRFVFTSPPSLTQVLAEPYRESLMSYGRPEPGELGDARPYVLRVVPAPQGAGVERLARQLPFESYREERFRVINGLAQGQEPQAGQLVKLIDVR